MRCRQRLCGWIYDVCVGDLATFEKGVAMDMWDVVG
jgi:hypothetical protein